MCYLQCVDHVVQIVSSEHIESIFVLHVNGRVGSPGSHSLGIGG